MPEGTTLAQFAAPADGATIGIMSSNKVGPTIADDIKSGSLSAVFLSLDGVFLYFFFRFYNSEKTTKGKINCCINDYRTFRTKS